MLKELAMIGIAVVLSVAVAGVYFDFQEPSALTSATFLGAPSVTQQSLKSTLKKVDEDILLRNAEKLFDSNSGQFKSGYYYLDLNKHYGAFTLGFDANFNEDVGFDGNIFSSLSSNERWTVQKISNSSKTERILDFDMIKTGTGLGYGFDVNVTTEQNNSGILVTSTSTAGAAQGIGIITYQHFADWGIGIWPDAISSTPGATIMPGYFRVRPQAEGVESYDLYFDEWGTTPVWAAIYFQSSGKGYLKGIDMNTATYIVAGIDMADNNILNASNIQTTNLNVNSDANFETIGVSGDIYGNASKIKGIERMECDDCTASGMYSAALGVASTASGIASTATGNTTTASGESSLASGDSCTASGDWSTALGYSTTASGNYCTALNDTTFSIGDATTSMGNWTTASGWYTLATGYYSQSANYGSFAGGYGAVNKGPFALGQGSMAFGNSDVNMVAKGKGAIALGYNTQALGEATIALGKNIVCERPNQTCVHDFNATGDINLNTIESKAILSDTGYLLLGGTEQASNNNLKFDFTDGSGRIYISSPSGATLVGFDAMNLQVDGDLTDGLNSLTVADAKAAYDHSQDNTQAHSDYLLNNASDSTSGVLTAAGLASTGDSNFANVGMTGKASGFGAIGDSNFQRIGSTTTVITPELKPAAEGDTLQIHPDADGAGLTRVGVFANSGAGERARFSIYGYSDALSAQKYAAIGIDSSGRLDFTGTATAAVFSTDMAIGDEKKLYWGGTVSGFLSQNKQSGGSNRHTTFGGSNDAYDEPVWVLTDYARILSNLGVYDVGYPQMWFHDGSATAANMLRIFHNGTDANITSGVGKIILGNDVNVLGELGVSGNVIADDYLEFTPAFTGTSKDALQQITAISQKDGEIDHSTLPEFVKQKVPEYTRTYVGKECSEVIDQEACVLLKSSVPESCVESPEAKECQVECTQTRTVCQDKYESKLTGERDARSLGATVTMLVEAVKALKEENDALKIRVQALEGKTI